MIARRLLTSRTFCLKRCFCSLPQQASAIPEIKPVVDTSKGIYLRPLPGSCVDFAGPEGKKRFGEALAKGNMESYFRLAGQYHAQSEPAFCGIAVLCMILNSLSIDPQRIWKSPWRWYSEEMISCCIPLDEIKKQGITFDSFASMAACQGASVEAIRPDTKTEEEFRADIQRATSTNTEFIVVSYDRKSIGQTGTGHFSPVAGYHQETDSVLLLDVARFKYPPHWVSVPLIYSAMLPVDITTGKPRGYFKIGRSDEIRNLDFCQTKNVAKIHHL